LTSDEARTFATSIGLKLRYDVDLLKLGGAVAPFTQLGIDEGTARYLAGSSARRHGVWKTWLHRLLRGFLSDFDINGYLGTYPMHVLSTAQWKTLLPVSGGAHLDIGAGRGDATQELAALFKKTVVTETSRAMARRLRKLGFECIEGDVSQRRDLGGKFDIVSLLNVLDRCDQPLSLLATARQALKPGGHLVIALVLPYRPFVYDGGQARAPRERLPIVSSEWELAATEFMLTALLPLGLEVVTFSRAPYLSGGDAERPLYELDDLIVVCRAVGEVPLLGL
jgi:SAM-dependent methyltransferase